jgi:hypothetical protein
MFYLDYTWDLHSDRIILDPELNTKPLGWEEGDHFKLIKINGRTQLVKIDAVELFSKGVQVNGT